jgi:hypothetical protein
MANQELNFSNDKCPKCDTAKLLTGSKEPNFCINCGTNFKKIEEDNRVSMAIDTETRRALKGISSPVAIQMTQIKRPAPTPVQKGRGRKSATKKAQRKSATKKVQKKSATKKKTQKK